MKAFIKISLFLLLILIFYVSYSQNSEYIDNGDFNSPYTGDSPPPPKWYTCDAYADVDIIRSNPNNPNSEEAFLQMRARSRTYYEPNSYDHLKSTREYVSQLLKKPLESNSKFIFTAYIHHNLFATFNDEIAEDINVSYPLKIIVLGGNDSCNIKRLLLSTSTISDTAWVKYEIPFNTGDTAFSFIKIQVQWDIPGVRDFEYNGELSIDSVNIRFDCVPKDTIYHNVNYIGDGKTILQPETVGSSYEWTPSENLDPTNGPLATMKYYIPGQNQIVTIKQSGFCPIIEKFNINFDCDFIRHEDTTTYYYKYFEPVVLKADTNGVYYNWSPKENLSAYNSCCPKLLDYEPFYSVSIKDKYGCEYIDEFKIEALCDSLVPGKSAIVLDVSLKERTEMVLSPKVGTVINCSWTPLSYLEVSGDCQTAIANPINERTYFVTVEDSFGCIHEERFHIFIEMKVPNVFTPNGDGYNDLFMIPGLPDRTSLKIFDRNGNIIFSANQYVESNYWDGGDKNGKPVPTGTYWFVLENPQLGVIKKGYVMVVR